MAGRWRAEVAAATSTPPLASGWLAEVAAAAGWQWGGSGEWEGSGLPSHGRRLAGRGGGGGGGRTLPSARSGERGGGELPSARSDARGASGEVAGSCLAEAAAAQLGGGSGRTLPMRRRRRAWRTAVARAMWRPATFLGELVLDEYTSLLLSLSRIQEAVTKGSRDGLEGGTAVECGW
uniref:Uncharacterized protein n=1 Tax=Oryza rufipogon TaxID=4529 RepID=A0A0E0PKD7_ORYRU